ncbi:MAG: DUF1295 domain-containing protein [Bradymonadia bacterium]
MPNRVELMQAVLSDAFTINGVFFLLVWVVATVKKRLHLIDVLWGPSYGITLLVCLTHANQLTLPQVILAVGVLTWSIRLGFHLLPRIAHKIEDRRYTAMREGRSPLFFIWWSLVAIFALQLCLSITFSLPFIYGLLSPNPPTQIFVFAVGMTLAFAGLGYESIADWQLSEFKASKENQHDVLNTGLWRFSRHPNYFGESVFWWGIWLSTYTLGAPSWTLCCPVGLTFLLLRVSGVTLMESTITDRRPAYESYRRTTNAFLPGRPHNGA